MTPVLHCAACFSRSSFFAGQLIYEWEQSLEELNVFIRPPPNVTAAMIECVISTGHVTLGLRGSRDKFLDVRASELLVVDS